MLYQLAHPVNLLGIVVGLVVGLLVHDAAQTLVAQVLGDDTARRSGRLTAGAAARVEPFGAVAAVIVGWGWGSEVAVDERWRARRYRSAIALAAGPVSYVVLCLLTLVALRIAEPQVPFAILNGTTVIGTANAVLVWMALTFAALAVLSIVPVPPLDGGRIMLLLAPQTLGWQKARYQLVERNFGIVIALAVVLLPRVAPLPGVIEQLAPQLLHGLASLVGLTVVVA